MPDVSILLTEIGREAEKTGEEAIFLIKRAMQLVFSTVSALDKAGLQKHGLRDNLEAKDIAMAALNDYHHEISDEKAFKSLISDLLTDRKGNREKDGLLAMTDFVVKTRELRDFCHALASRPSEFTRAKLEILRTMISRLKNYSDPPKIRAERWINYQPMTLGMLMRNIDIKPIIDRFDVLSTLEYEESATKKI